MRVDAWFCDGSVTAVFGGMNKHEQFKALKAGCEIVVATPVSSSSGRESNPQKQSLH
jgi:hypothetical protein